MERLHADRVLRAIRRGSSWPVIVDAGGRRLFVKLRGAAQGVAPLVAEVIVAGLAEAIDLRVPARALVHVDASVASDDRHEELRALLKASAGWNLGFDELRGAVDLRPEDAAGIDEATASRIVWLDGLVVNEDRGPMNPNLMIDGRGLWLVDHGAALGFHHDWAAVDEEAPRRAYAPVMGHVLGSRAVAVAELDAALAARLPRERITAIVDEVPDELLGAPRGPRGDEARRRRRAAYVAFLWKRLKAPRAFAQGVAARGAR
ncbi:MAG: HipA family kinase [Nannocystaceae bacterium]